jgi:hypothetical protein
MQTKPQPAEATVAETPVTLAEIVRYVSFFDAILGAEWRAPAQLAPLAPGVTRMNAGMLPSPFRDFPSDPKIVAQIRAFGGAHRRDVAERAREAEEARRAIPHPFVLVEPRRLAAVEIGGAPPAAPLSWASQAKVAQYDTILASSPWLERSGLSRERLYQAAVYAEPYLQSLNRAPPDRARNASGTPDRAERWLYENRFGTCNISLGSIVLAAFALGVEVEHERELQPWLIFLGVK